MRYWIWWNDLVQGPFDLDELSSLRSFSEELLVCMEDREEWLPAGRVADLSSAIEQLRERHSRPLTPPPPPPSRPPTLAPLQGEFFGEAPGQQPLLESDDGPKGPYAYREDMGDGDSMYSVGTPTMPFHFARQPQSRSAVLDMPRPQPQKIFHFTPPPVITESPVRVEEALREEHRPTAKPVVSLNVLREETVPEEIAPSKAPVFAPYESPKRLEWLPWLMGIILALVTLGGAGYWVIDRASTHSAIAEATRLESSKPRVLADARIANAIPQAVPSSTLPASEPYAESSPGAVSKPSFFSILGHKIHSLFGGSSSDISQGVTDPDLQKILNTNGEATSSAVGETEATAIASKTSSGAEQTASIPGQVTGAAHQESSASRPSQASTDVQAIFSTVGRKLYSFFGGSTSDVSRNATNSDLQKVPNSNGQGASPAVGETEATTVASRTSSGVERAVSVPEQAMSGTAREESSASQSLPSLLTRFVSKLSSSPASSVPVLAKIASRVVSGSSPSEMPSSNSAIPSSTSAGAQTTTSAKALWHESESASAFLKDAVSSLVGGLGVSSGAGSTGIKPEPSAETAAAVSAVQTANQAASPAAASAPQVLDSENRPAQTRHQRKSARKLSATRKNGGRKTPENPGSSLKQQAKKSTKASALKKANSVPAPKKKIADIPHAESSPAATAVPADEASAQSPSPASESKNVTPTSASAPTPTSMPIPASAPAPLPGVGAAPSPSADAAIPAVDSSVPTAPAREDVWASRQNEAIKLALAKTLPKSKITVGEQARTMLQQMHEKELLHAAETGERLYLPDKIAWSALQEEGSKYLVYLNFMASQANGERVQARSYHFAVDLNTKQVRADDPATEQDLLATAAELTFKHNPMATDIDSILGGVDTYNKHKVQLMIVKKNRSNREERKKIESAVMSAQNKVKRGVIYFLRTYSDKALQNIAKAYSFETVLKE